MAPESHVAMIGRLQEKVDAGLAGLVSPGEPLALLDFPDIRNPGDSAIWLGEIAWLGSRLGTRPAYVSRMQDYSPEDLERAVPAGPIFIHGGGNFGDIWVGHQNFREKVIARFPGRRIVQFPQSIHYGSRERIAETARVIGRHGDFVLMVRDRESQAFAETHFDCRVVLCPDMAVCIGPREPPRAEIPVLAVLRTDIEKAGDHDPAAAPNVPVEDWLNGESRWRVRLSQTLAVVAALGGAPGEIRLRKFDAAARSRFRRGIRQIARGRAIVTDRLHVHISSLLLGRPHAVLDNSYGKVRRFLDAFTGESPLTYRAASLADGIEWARQHAT